jgi:predicted unusual protein kinase regulating ubiquinone biosynthesis (AarF/ABC1/UbiB family)
MEGLLIKTCQFISSRADVAPPEYVAVLSRLQDRVPPRPFKQVVQQIESELGAHPDELFDAFSRAPIASASLAQVHRATTKDGDQVAVKVQYRGIERVVETDLRNLSILVRILARIERDFDFRVLMEEVNRYVPRELDFELEGRSAERVAKELAHRKDVAVPRVYWDHTARRVLTTAFVDGIKISDIPRLQEHGIDPNEVALIMTEAYCEQILVHGFFHADPHPGNLLVLPGPVVVFIDFGLCKELPEEFRLNYARLTLAIMRQEARGMVDAFRALGFKTKSEDPDSLVALGKSFFD